MKSQAIQSPTVQPVPRWLVVIAGDEQIALSFDYLLRIIDDAQVYSVPLCGDYFQGVIYYQEQAVPVLNWRAISKIQNQGRMFLILKEGADLVALQINEVKEILYAQSKELSDELWCEFDSNRRALKVEKLFTKLRQGSFKAEEQGGENG